MTIIKTEITVQCEDCREELPAKIEQEDGAIFVTLDTEKIKKHQCSDDTESSDLKTALKKFENDNTIYDILDAATDIDEFSNNAIAHIIDFVWDSYDAKSFVDELSDEQKEELKELL